MDIADWRKKIDEIDLRLVDLLNERTRCAVEIGKLKRLHQQSLYDPDREVQVIENVCGANKGPLQTDALQRLFERIIDEARRAARLAMEMSGDE
ncbi:MAG TPA: chorismate mutase [Acidobacteriota bacterium]|nr:chorismate mutase [Acidobacteriota bacterium]